MYTVFNTQEPTLDWIDLNLSPKESNPGPFNYEPLPLPLDLSSNPLDQLYVQRSIIFMTIPDQKNSCWQPAITFCYYLFHVWPSDFAVYSIRLWVDKSWHCSKPLLRTRVILLHPSKIWQKFSSHNGIEPGSFHCESSTVTLHQSGDMWTTVLCFIKMKYSHSWMFKDRATNMIFDIAFECWYSST